LDFFENFPVFGQLSKATLFEKLIKEIAQKFFFSQKCDPFNVADENSPVGRADQLTQPAQPTRTFGPRRGLRRQYHQELPLKF